MTVKVNKPAGSTAAMTEALQLKYTLDTATNGLNKNLVAAEKALMELSLGVTSYVHLYDYPNEFFARLCFQKVGNDWRLVVEEGRDLGPDEADEITSTTPIINCSRAYRVRAAELLPNLFENLVAAAKRQVKSVEEASSKVDAFLKDLQNADIPF